MSRGRVIVVVVLLALLSLIYWKKYGTIPVPSVLPGDTVETLGNISIPEVFNQTKEVPFPTNSMYWVGPEEECVAPFTLITPNEGNSYYIKLKDITEAKKDIVIYVGANATFETKVPLGEYWMYYACGSKWYGMSDLFGINTISYKIEHPISFIDDNFYRGHIVKFSAPDGNLTQERVNKDELK